MAPRRPVPTASSPDPPRCSAPNALRGCRTIPTIHRTINQASTEITSPAELDNEGDITCPVRSSPTQLKKFDREQFYTPNEAVGLAKNTASAKFDETIDVVAPARRRSPQGRPDGAWHRRPALGHRQGRPRRRLRHRRGRRRGPCRRRRHRRCRRPGRRTSRAA